MADEQGNNRSGADTEKTIRDVLDDLSSGRVDRGASEQIRDAAIGSIKKHEQNDSDGSLGRAINRGGHR